MRSSFRPLVLRAVQLTIAFTILAVPAEAFALSGTAGSSDIPSTTALPIRVAPRHVRLGTPVHVTGHLPASDAGTTVELQSAHTAHGPWRRMTTARVGASGAYNLRAAPRHSAVLRVLSMSATAPADTSAMRATSGDTSPRATVGRPAIARVAPIQVKAVMHVARRARGVTAGHELALAGRLAPGRSGRTVAVQRHSGHAWRTVAHGRTGRRGGFTVRFRPAADAHGELRVLFAGDRANGRATAAAGLLAVYEPVVVSWYEDGGVTACGFHAAYGVANRSLPCGTRVHLRRGGRSVTATVDDRGPYVGGRDYDLDQSTAAALGFSGVGTLDASVQ